MIAILLASVLGFQNISPYTPHEEPPIAYFDVVPQQYVTGIFNMGVVAYHLEGVDRVEYTIHREGFVGDWNHDGIADGQDLGILIERWNQGVGGRDLGRLLGAWGQSIPHTPEKVIRYESAGHNRLNPRTGEKEYWFGLDTRTHPDTKITVTAEIFPVDGPSLVLDQNIEDVLDEGYWAREYVQWLAPNLFSNNGGRYNGPILYMSPDGDDATADGTMEKPFANFMPALRHSVGHNNPYMIVEGTRFYMLPGEYTLNSGALCDTIWSACSTEREATKFISVSPAPGYSRGDVILGTVPGESLGLGGRTPVHFKDIVFMSGEEHWLNPGNTIRWYDNCTISGDADEWWAGNFVRSQQPHSGYQYYTDCTQQYQAEGNAGIIMRNMLMDHIHCDVLEKHWINMALSIMITNHNAAMENDTTGCHIDYIQINGGFNYMLQNRIMRDVFGNHSCFQQGVHACPGEGNGIGIAGCVWDTVELSNTGGLDLPRCNISALIFRWCGPARNNLFVNCMFHGKPTDDGQVGNVHSTTSYIRNYPDGSRNEEGPWCVIETGELAGEPRYKNVKFEDCWNDWDRTIPLFLKPDVGEPWVFYGPDELQFDSDTRDGFNDNEFGPDRPWFSPITGILYTQTE